MLPLCEKLFNKCYKIYKISHYSLHLHTTLIGSRNSLRAQVKCFENAYEVISTEGHPQLSSTTQHIYSYSALTYGPQLSTCVDIVILIVF